jgi:hypothetical protein
MMIGCGAALILNETGYLTYLNSLSCTPWSFFITDFNSVPTPVILFIMRLSYLVSVVALPFVVSALSVRDDTATSAEDSFPDFETVQLTEADLAPLNDTLTAVFTFDSVNVTESLSKRTIRGRTAPTGCKVFPGDAAWPADCVWDVLDQLVGGALIKTIPIGAPCYAGPNYVGRCFEFIKT